jgi:hypothetical protein
MLFSHWLRRTARPDSTFRPDVCLLEDRTVPALLRTLTPPIPVSPPATHLQVIVPLHVESDKAFSVVVEAEDAKNHVVADYKGAVQIAMTGIGTKSFTFSANDHGKLTIQMNVAATGTHTVKATSGAIAGQTAFTVDPKVTHFSISASTSTFAGAETSFTVSALDANNQVVPGYTGTVHFTSTDYSAWLPTDYTFQTVDNGSHVFSLTFNTSAIHTLTVTSSSNSSVLGSTQVQVLLPWYYPTTYVYSPGYGSWGYSWY